jgi:hypothetical protein
MEKQISHRSSRQLVSGGRSLSGMRPMKVVRPLEPEASHWPALAAEWYYSEKQPFSPPRYFRDPHPDTGKRARKVKREG